MRKLVTCLALLAAFAPGIAISQTQTKFDFYLATKVQGLAESRINGSELIPVFVKGNMAEVKKLVANCNGIFKYSYGNIAAVQIPVSALPAFQQSTAVTRMEGQPSHMRVMNDTMRVRNHLVEVQMGQSPLTHGYKGNGVIMAFIDSGIDILHPDFQDTTNRSRVKFLWDQNLPNASNTPQPYNYGQEWTQAELDTAMSQNNTAALQLMDSSGNLEFGHGSNVAGTGAGNARSNGRNMGADPDADIIMVAFNFNNYTNPNLMTDAVDYIINKATLLGEPVVINASLGDYGGSHDGQDLQAQMIDSMITSRPGICFVAAGGNAGAIPYHVSYPNHTGDTLFSWFSYNGSNVDIQVYGDTAQFRNVQFAIGADQNSPDYVFRGQTAFSSIFPYLVPTPPTYTLKNSNNQPLGTITYYAQLTGGTYSLEMVIVPDSTSYYWRFTTTGSGNLDCWDFGNTIYSGLPSQATFPDMRNYKMPDTNETICSSFQCSPHVITVANYWNHGAILDYDTNVVSNPNYVPCQLAAASSKGPTRDGRIKPDISASGNWTLSTLPLSMRAFDIINSPTSIDIGGYHDIDGGTSLASPMVAGAAGMLMELYPLATNDKIKNMLIYCADEDVCTGSNLPNNAWGFGKLDAFKSMTGCALGITGIPNVPTAELSVYPNPTMSSTTINYDFTSITEYCTAQIEVYDVMGKEVKSIELKNSKGNVTFNKGDIQGGTYFYSLLVDGKRLRTDKLVIM